MKPMPKLRLFTPQPLIEGQVVPLSLEQGHYLLHVMRASAGDEILLFNGKDGEWGAELTLLGKKAAEARPRRLLRPQRAEPDLWLLFAPVKRQRIDFIVEKATELGVSGLFPVWTKNVNVSRVKDGRLESIAIEAAEQCERLSTPFVHAPVDLSVLMDRWPEDRILLFLDEGDARSAIADQLAILGGKKLAVLVGPEGGFTEDERKGLIARPFSRSVGLGPRILRADTAAIAALSCIQAISGDWRSTSPILNSP